MTASVFAKYQQKMWPHRFAGSLHVGEIAGGVPTDPKKAEGFIRSKVEASDDTIRRMVAETMVERGITADEATDEVARNKHLNGFRFDERGLYIPGPNLKACLKEAVNVAANSGRITTKGWGNPDNANYKKGIKAWFPEHVFVEEDRLYLGVAEATRVNQRFVHVRGLSGIQYEEIVEDAKIDFTIETDHDFTGEQWAAVWTTAERLGLGASRSLGFGRFVVTRWDPITD
jgi:hypothetical protein